MLSEPRAGTVLLVGEGLCRAVELVAAIQELGLEAQFVRVGSAALEQIRRSSPALIVVDAGLEDIRSHSLVSLIREDESLAGIPVVAVVDDGTDGSRIFSLLEAGADDCIAIHDNLWHVMAKMELVTKRRSSMNAVRQYYSELRLRQTQTLDFVRATTSLLESIDREFRSRGNASVSADACLLEEQLDMGLEIVRSLVSILDKEIVAADSSDLLRPLGVVCREANRDSRAREERIHELALAH
jgi:DNA-binding response OmpR family regulator